MSVCVTAVQSVRPVILRFHAQSHPQSHIVADMDVCTAATAYIVPFFLSEDHFFLCAWQSKCLIVLWMCTLFLITAIQMRFSVFLLLTLKDCCIISEQFDLIQWCFVSEAHLVVCWKVQDRWLTLGVQHSVSSEKGKKQEKCGGVDEVGVDLKLLKSYFFIQLFFAV